MPGKRPRGEYLARLKAYRANRLASEGFTEREIIIYAQRRISSPGILYLRRERRAELRGLTPEEIEEWRQQHEESRDEAYAAEALRDVSPD